MAEPADPYAGVSPPSPSDGPQEAVDWTELEEEGHPLPPTEGDLTADG